MMRCFRARRKCTRLFCALFICYFVLRAIRYHQHQPHYCREVAENVRAQKIPIQNRRIVIVGAGPTGLGAAYRLYELGILHSNTQVVILEQEPKAGGLASSHRDSRGYLWDNGGHVVFSHYNYFESLLNKVVTNWKTHKRAAFAFMKGSSGQRRFIPYPVQENVMAMDEEERKSVLKELQHLSDYPDRKSPRNFDEWLVKTFGEKLCEIFMRKYNRKLWTVDPKEMNADWVGERVAEPSMEKIMKNGGQQRDSQWGPNRFFRFPRYNGTGSIWTAVADLLPRGWFHFGHKVSSVDILKKQLKIHVSDDKSTENSKNTYSLDYDILINTSPLDALINMDINNSTIKFKRLANKLMYSHTHIIGIGLKGQAPKHLADKSWIYFPDSDSPFYRVTVFSIYSDDLVPNSATDWSLMCEVSEPKHVEDSKVWAKENLIRMTVSALVNYGFISEEQVVSRYYRYLDHGYPVPSLDREEILQSLQPWLESHDIYSRGRFGGWRYEVSNQDHSLMQGVEVADWLVRNIPEETYCNPNLVNSMKGSNRTLYSKVNTDYFQKTDYEIVVAHYDENLEWLRAESRNVHLYHKGKMVVPDLRFKQWEILPNVGRESHTYIHHIIHNYHRLADVTIFIQAGAYEHVRDCHTNMREYVNLALKESYAVKNSKSFSDWGYIKHSGKYRQELESGKLRRSKYSVGDFWVAAGLGNPHPRFIEVSFKGCFAATRERIHFRSLDTYKKLISFVDDHRNPEEGHYFERLWHGIFFGN